MNMAILNVAGEKHWLLGAPDYGEFSVLLRMLLPLLNTTFLITSHKCEDKTCNFVPVQKYGIVTLDDHQVRPREIK